MAMAATRNSVTPNCSYWCITFYSIMLYFCHVVEFAAFYSDFFSPLYSYNFGYSIFFFKKKKMSLTCFSEVAMTLFHQT
ncbi:hypothetical protein BDF21DRAFT_431430 [Thamnidium elegans]|nr:hypothetical protein BDF21DRAFT_431430 [Thamnidium elegans]